MNVIRLVAGLATLFLLAGPVGAIPVSRVAAESPLYVTIDIDGSRVTLVAQSEGHLQTVGPLDKGMFMTRRELAQIYEGRDLAILYWKTFPFRVYRLN